MLIRAPNEFFNLRLRYATMRNRMSMKCMAKVFIYIIIRKHIIHHYLQEM